MIKDLKEHYLLNDIPKEFQHYSKDIQTTNLKRLEKYIEPVVSTHSNISASDSEVLMLLLCLLCMDDKWLSP